MEMTQSDKQNVIAELEEMLRLAKIKHEQIQHEAAHHWTIAIYLEKEIKNRKETLKKEKEREEYDVKVAIEEPTIDWAKEEEVSTKKKLSPAAERADHDAKTIFDKPNGI